VNDSRIRAVIFDFDGVLADTERLHLAAFQDVFAPYGWTLDERTYFDRYLGYDDRDLVAAFAREQQVALADADARRLLAEKAQRFAARLGAGEALFAGAVACIDRLGRGHRLAIASGALRHEIIAVLDGVSRTGAFAAIVGADDVGRSKPAPDPYRLAVHRLDVNPADAVAVEDSRWGLESARAAGLRAIGITTSYPASALGAADVVVGSLDEITPGLIERVLAAAID
jgi:beta-phosphoglucomutase